MTAPPDNAPRITPWLIAWFSRYATRYVGRQFRAVRVLRPPAARPHQPLVVYLNHASWWDPLICLLLWRRFFQERSAFAPIDAAALEKYAFFKRLGFFPVRQSSPRGAVDFMRVSQRILADHKSMLWVTPQGRFVDARELPRFKAGLARLAQRSSHAAFIPLAIEYVFWDERKPEVCVNFGAPVPVAPNTPGEVLEGALAEAQYRLAEAVRQRDARLFTSVQQSPTGVGGVYDLWRRARAAVELRPFNAAHRGES